jgi:hypothetical protein
MLLLMDLLAPLVEIASEKPHTVKHITGWGSWYTFFVGQLESNCF